MIRYFGWIFIFSSMAWALNQQVDPVIPQREVSIIVTKEGYYPKKIVAFKGEKIKFYVTSTVEEPDCFILQGHKVFLAAQKGKITEAEVHMEHEGEFSFYCPSSKNDGKLTVIHKKSEGRDIASDREWRPKDR